MPKMTKKLEKFQKIDKKLEKLPKIKIEKMVKI